MIEDTPTPRPKPLSPTVIMTGDGGPKCPKCGSSFSKKWIFFRTEKCISPFCENFNPKRGPKPKDSPTRTRVAGPPPKPKSLGFALKDLWVDTCYKTTTYKKVTKVTVTTNGVTTTTETTETSDSPKSTATATEKLTPEQEKQCKAMIDNAEKIMDKAVEDMDKIFETMQKGFDDLKDDSKK